MINVLSLRHVLLQVTLVIGIFGTTDKASAVTAPIASNDVENLSYSFSYSGSPDFIQLFLDTDSNAASGYSVAGIGADYLIEDGMLYRFSAASQSSWSWRTIKTIFYSTINNSAKMTLAKTDLGSPSRIRLVARTHPPMDTSSVVTQTMSSSATASASVSAPITSYDSTHVHYQYSYTGSPSFFRIYLDTDSNVASGYAVGGIGANFLVENGVLYRYSGASGAWGWSYMNAVPTTNSIGTVRNSIARGDLGSPSTIVLVAQIGPSQNTSSRVVQNLSSATPAPTPMATPGPTPLPTPIPTATPAPAPTGDVKNISYSPNAATIYNPERGFYRHIDCNQSPSTIQSYRANGESLVMCNFRLDSFVNSPISQSALDGFQKQMDNVRAGGVKTVLRIVYNYTDNATDAALPQLRGHLDQLAPILSRNKDVIAAVQAGMIGSWGEWANSRNYGIAGSLSTQNWADRKAVVDKLLQVVPADRMVQLRTPDFQRKMFGTEALTDTEAFNGSAKARLGQHNDCFLASSSDWGTYSNVSVEYPWLAQQTKHTVMGGETCNVSAPRTGCSTALKELSQFHWSYLNLDFHKSVLDGWRNEGCFDQVKQKLGYRFVLQSGTYSTSAKAGGSFSLDIRIANQGYATLYNSRSLQLILRNDASGAVFRMPLSADPRRWLPGQTNTISQSVTLPGNIPAGNYSVLLNLPDAATPLANRPEYSIQLANTSTWEPSTGFNNLRHTVIISP